MTMIKMEILYRRLSAIWLLSMVLLVGCTNNDGARSVKDTGLSPVVFSVSTEGASPQVTRGMLENELNTEFGLLCLQYLGTAWGAEEDDKYMMYNEMVMGNGDTWQTAEGYFIPDPAYKLKFYAYYPFFDKVDGTSPIKMSSNSYKGTPYFDYTMPANAKDQSDVMYAISDEMQPNSNKQLPVVRLHFKHLLTAITIAVGQCAESGTVRRVTLTNIYNKGRFRYDNAGITSKNDEGKIDIYADLDLRIIAGQDWKLPSVDKSFLIIPQSELHSSASLIVQYEAGGKIYPFSVKLSELATSLEGEAKNILLRVSVTSLQRMRIQAYITDWGEGANFDGAVSDQPTVEFEATINDWSSVSSDDKSTSTDITTGPDPTVTGYGESSSTPEP